jgi:hypothetical protein
VRGSTMVGWKISLELGAITMTNSQGCVWRDITLAFENLINPIRRDFKDGGKLSSSSAQFL